MPSACNDTPHGPTKCVTFRCSFAECRAASRQLCDFLAHHGVEKSDLFACELALTEACNNAVQHVGDRGRPLPISASAMCVATRIELCVTDHSDGFVWPTGVNEPPPVEAEHGRGVFIIRSVMDGAAYVRGDGENTLTMWKSRSPRPSATAS